MKCDRCGQPGVSLVGESNEIITCIDHARAYDRLFGLDGDTQSEAYCGRCGHNHAEERNCPYRWEDGTPCIWCQPDREARVTRAVEASPAKVLRAAANYFETRMGRVWGGDATWITNGNRVADLVANVLRERADDQEPY